jgi:hypothetical protein
MSKPENEKIVSSAAAIDTPAEQQQQQQQGEEEQKIEIPASQYTNLINANLQSHLNTLNTLDCFDKFISSLINLQAYAMNMKEDIKKQQLGLNKQQQPLTDKTDAK